MFLRNCWYAAGFSEELGREFLARTFLDEAIVMFRLEDGTPVALENRCAHRRVPLSMGKLVGDVLECGYHGLRYDCSGACVHIPGQKKIPKGTGVRGYPVIERHRYVWIWMGDPDAADEALLPEYQMLDDPALGVSNIQFHMDTNVQLIVDNLMDLSHLAYVHGTTTGSPEIAEEAKVETIRKGDVVQVRRWMENVVPAPAFVEFGGYTGNIDSWQVSEFSPPTYVRVSYGSAPTGYGIPKKSWFEDQGHWGFYVFHGLTPETDKRSHQFRYIAYSPGEANKKTIKAFRQVCDQIITEDSVVFPVQQVAIDSDPAGADANNINEQIQIIHDGGLLASRRIVERKLKEEAKLTKGKKPKAKQPKAKQPKAKKSKSASRARVSA
jgi:phenylpropionate dioxygenase-like ring-hydroxylating dioxygenase large terminal subunit